MKTHSFSQRVYDLLGEIPAGRVCTYGELARALDCGSARAVGQALRRNPDAPRVPCHRVVRADGALGGYQGRSAGEALERKTRLLRDEGVIFRDGARVDLDRCGHRFAG